jgi:hypothetical protein
MRGFLTKENAPPGAVSDARTFRVNEAQWGGVLWEVAHNEGAN